MGPTIFASRESGWKLVFQGISEVRWFNGFGCPGPHAFCSADPVLRTSQGTILSAVVLRLPLAQVARRFRPFKAFISWRRPQPLAYKVSSLPIDPPPSTAHLNVEYRFQTYIP